MTLRAFSGFSWVVMSNVVAFDDDGLGLKRVKVSLKRHTVHFGADNTGSVIGAHSRLQGSRSVQLLGANPTSFVELSDCLLRQSQSL